METLAKIGQAFGEKSMSHTRLFEGHTRFRADRTFIGDDQYIGPSAAKRPKLLLNFNSYFVRIDVEPFRTLLMKSELVMGRGNGF
jgi:hypothetical protein